MNILKAREIAVTAMADYLKNLKKGEEVDLANAFANILAEQTTDAFLRGVKFGKGYKEAEE